MANDYISKQDVLKGQKTGTFANGVAFEAIRVVPVGYIESLEPADVVQVVRCVDCRRCSYDPLFNYFWCNLTLGTRRVKPDDFCSYGEKRGEE